MRTLTILDGQTDSEELELREVGMTFSRSLGFYIPNHGAAITLHVSTAPGGTFVPLNDGFGNDYSLVSSKYQYVTLGKIGAIKLIAAAAVTGNQVFTVVW